MKYQIIGKNIEVTEGIKEALLKKLHRMDKYFVINDDVECRAVVRTYKTGQKPFVHCLSECQCPYPSRKQRLFHTLAKSGYRSQSSHD